MVAGLVDVWVDVRKMRNAPFFYGEIPTPHLRNRKRGLYKSEPLWSCQNSRHYFKEI